MKMVKLPFFIHNMVDIWICIDLAKNTCLGFFLFYFPNCSVKCNQNLSIRRWCSRLLVAVGGRAVVTSLFIGTEQIK